MNSSVMASGISMVLLVACGDDGEHISQSREHVYDTVSIGARGDTSVDAPDTTVAFDSQDARDAEVDADVADSEADLPAPPSPEIACDRAARLASCDAPLLEPAPMPEDAHDPLFYVNREFAIPADFPVSATSTWTPCQGGSAPGGAEHDLICLPDAYSTQAAALRQPAWESNAPAAPTTTFDGKPVGLRGKIGFKAAFDAALEEGAGELFGASCFRSYARQETLFESYVADELGPGVSEDEAAIIASTFSAHAGHSEHQLGTTCDLVYRKADGSVSSFGRASARTMYDSPAFRWLAENGHRFGLVVTYAPDRVAITQYVWEPWHWRFVGVLAADAIKRCGLSTEELLNARYDAGPLPAYDGDPLILYAALRIVTGNSGTVPVGSGEAFTRSWTVENTGTVAWWHDVFAHIDGENFGGGDVDVACTPPLARTTLTLALTAPEQPGTYAGSWRLLDDAGREVVPDTFDVRAFVGNSVPTGAYRYVRITDVSGASGGADPGVDLDAIVLLRPGAAPRFALAVVSYEATPNDVTRADPADALGAPDAFADYPDTSTCEVDGGFVALGGRGAIVLDFGAGIEAGDTLEVLEVGACDYGAGTAVADRFQAHASFDGTATGAWEPIGNSSGGPARFTVPFLPPSQP